MGRSDLAAEYRRLGYWKPETLAGRRIELSRQDLDRVAIVDGDRALTFEDVGRLVHRLAGRLAEMGVGPGDVVSWQLPNGWEAVVVHHAALRLGAVPNPLNAIFRARELRFVLPQARPKVLIVADRLRGFDAGPLAVSLRGELPGLERVITVGGAVEGAVELEALLQAPGAAPPEPPEDPSADALLLHSSGATGDPKGIRHSHETLLYEIDSLVPMHGLTPKDRYLGGSPVSHIAGLVYGVLMPFAIGTSTTFLDRWDAGRALQAIERDAATFQTGTPTFLQTLAAEAAGTRADVSSFRLFSTGGATIPAEAIAEAGRALGCVVKRAYGSTEVPTLTASFMRDPEEVRLRSDGRPIGPAEMRIAEDGEILARSPEVFLGYADPVLDDEAFDDDGWYRTGDLGEVDERGCLHVTGRLKDLIIRGGENLSAAEIEGHLAAHPAVADVAVVGVADAVLGERACAVVVLRPGAQLTFEAMSEYMRGREIAPQKIPERLELRDELPRTASGKVAKAALRDELAGT